MTGLWIGTDLSWLEGLEFSTHPSWRGKGVEFELIIDDEGSLIKIPGDFGELLAFSTYEDIRKVMYKALLLHSLLYTVA